MIVLSVDGDDIVDLGQQNVRILINSSPNPIGSVVMNGIEQTIVSQGIVSGDQREVFVNITGLHPDGLNTITVAE